MPGSQGFKVRDLFLALMRHPVSLVGSALTTASAVVFLALLAGDVAGRLHNPYLGLVAYVLIPALFLLGLVLIPFGIALERRRARRAARGTQADSSVISVNVSRARRIVLAFLILTVVNVALLGTAGYKG